MLFPRLVDNFLVILRLKNDLMDRNQCLFNSFAMIQSRPRGYTSIENDEGSYFWWPSAGFCCGSFYFAVEDLFVVCILRRNK